MLALQQWCSTTKDSLSKCLTYFLGSQRATQYCREHTVQLLNAIMRLVILLLKSAQSKKMKNPQYLNFKIIHISVATFSLHKSKRSPKLEPTYNHRPS